MRTLIFLLLFALPLHAEWVRVGPVPQSFNAIDDLEADPSSPGTLYAASYRMFTHVRDSKVYVTRDYGRTWSPVPDALPAGNRKLAVDARGELHIGTAIRHLVTDPATPGRLYATNGAVTRSDDGGRSWIVLPMPDPRPGVSVMTVAPGITPDVVYAGTVRSWDILEGGSGSIWRSDDAGTTWRALTPVTYENETWLIVTTESRIYRTVSNNDLEKSDDGGATWQRLLVPAISISAIAARGADEVWVGTIGGHVYASLDGGVTWRERSLAPANAVYALTFSGGAVFAGTLDGVWMLRPGRRRAARH